MDQDFVKGKSNSLSELAVPILCGKELLGVLNAESISLNAFGEKEIMLMEILDAEVGSAIRMIKIQEFSLSMEKSRYQARSATKEVREVPPYQLMTS